MSSTANSKMLLSCYHPQKKTLQYSVNLHIVKLSKMSKFQLFFQYPLHRVFYFTLHKIVTFGYPSLLRNAESNRELLVNVNSSAYLIL